MRNIRFGGRRGFNRPSAFSGNKQPYKKQTRHTISEADLIRSIEYSRRNSNTADTGQEEYVSEHSFDTFGLNSQLLANIKARGYKSPSPIQDKAMPSIISGRDLIGIANTGTGKTAAFLIPLIHKTSLDKNQKVLIITPTRELADQIMVEFRSLASGMRLFSALLIGGNNIGRQIRDLQKNPAFVIGTPGRIKDLINRKYLNLAPFNNVVLDETDRMVDIGFINEIKLFISLLPKQRQSLFFSATVPQKVQDILTSFVQNAITVSVKKSDTCSNIEQDYIKANQDQRIEVLHDLLIKDGFEKVIVFGNTKWKVQKLADELVRRGFRAAAIHGNKKQSQRRTILEQFRNNEVKVLLATDVAARGLDIKEVSHVINYELPETYDDYIHRIGRTGRANKNGVALTFVGA